MSGMYDRFAPFYDLEYSHKVDDIAFYLQMAARYGAPILEIGVGSGRIAFELAAQGYEVWGVDESAAMLKQAQNKVRQLAPSVRRRVILRQMDMRRLSLRKKFRTVLIPFRAFLHNLTQADQLCTLTAIHRHLQPRGILAMDLFVPIYQVLAKSEWQVHIPEQDLASQGTGISISSRVRHDPLRQRLEIENIYHQKGRDRRAVMVYRYVFRYEMEALLIASGFKVLSCHNGFTGEPYDFHSGIMTFIAQKK